MPTPVIALDGSPEVAQPLKCAVAEKPNDAQRHKQEMLRYFVLAIALLAVIFLIAIALYYTQGTSVSIEHVSSLTREAFAGLRPSFSAQARWCEPGAPVLS